MGVLTGIMLLMLAANSGATHFKSCASPQGLVTRVEVKGCPDTDSRCNLVRGNMAEITIHFQSKVDSSSLRANVHGILFHVPIPFRLPNADACRSGVTCPIKNGQSYIYKNSINILHSYPPIHVNVKYELRDQNGSDVVCILIPSKIK